VEEDALDWDGDQDDEVEELACPSCGAMVYEETQQCPHCGDWITPTAPRGAPLWARVVGAVLVFALLFGFIAGLIRTIF